MAAKSAALQGDAFKYEAFEAYENDDVVGYFGKKLLNAGFNYYGNETMHFNYCIVILPSSMLECYIKQTVSLQLAYICWTYDEKMVIFAPDELSTIF